MIANHTEDLQLLARIKTGEPEAFDLLFLKYYSNLMRFCKSLLPYPSDEAEDVVLEVFHKFWQQRNFVTIHSSLSSFLYAAVKNRVYDYHRKHSLRTFTTLDAIPESLHLDYQSPDQIIEFKEICENLEKMVKMLPEKMQIIFRMNREDSLTYQEIADLLEISINSVKTQMYRAIKFLKENHRFNRYNGSAI